MYTELIVKEPQDIQVGCLREIGSNGEIGIRSIDAIITQTTNPIALFLSNNHSEMYCRPR